MALLIHEQDLIAINNMGYYSQHIDKELFLESLKSGNEIFLKHALKLTAFDKQIFREDVVINTIIRLVKESGRTNYLLNVLALLDISVWKNKYLKELIQVINQYANESYAKNRLLLSYNPLMSISLACEVLHKIGSSKPFALVCAV